MNEWDTIKYIFSHKFKGAVLKYTATMVATVVFDLTAAILIGVVTALILLVKRLSVSEINYEKVDLKRIGVTDATLAKNFSHACVVYITGPIIFANTQNIEEITEKIKEGCDTVLFSMRGASHIDTSGAMAFLELLQELKDRGIDVMICGLSNNAKEIMRRSGIVELIGEDNFYWSVDCALLGDRCRGAKARLEAC